MKKVCNISSWSHGGRCSANIQNSSLTLQLSKVLRNKQIFAACIGTYEANQLIFMDESAIATQLTMDGPGPYVVKRLPGKPFFVMAKGKSGQAKWDIIRTNWFFSGTPYCPRYLLVKVSSTATSLKALLTQRASTNLLSIPLIVCNPFQPQLGCCDGQLCIDLIESQ